ncbi:MAG: transporter substrate-binding domain-containing protein [Pseudomonadota bacterium]
MTRTSTYCARVLALLVAMGGCATARAEDLAVLIKEKSQGASGTAPAKSFQEYLGEELARALGRKAKFVFVPRKRLPFALAAGDADILCGYVEQWLPGQFGWSRPFVPVTDLIVTNKDARRPLKLADLAGQRIGTILGYRYIELEQALGDGFVRDDSQTGESNLDKLLIRRFDHAAVTQSTLGAYLRHARAGNAALAIHPPLIVKQIQTQCAVAPRSAVSVDALNAAIGDIVKNGVLERLLLLQE